MFTKEEGLQNLLNFSSEGNFAEHQVIDHVIGQLHANSNHEPIIFALAKGLSSLDDKLTKKMFQLGGEIKQEMLAVTLRHLFWDKIQMSQFGFVSLGQKAPNQITHDISDSEERIQEILVLLEEENFLMDSLEMSAGVILCTHLWRECHPRNFNPSLFGQLRDVCPDITNEEILQFLGELYFLSQEQIQDIFSFKESIQENYRAEHIEQILSAFIFHQAGLNYLINNHPAILLAKMTYCDLKSFYSDELNWIPRDLYREARARFNLCISLQSFSPLPFTNTYLEFLKDQLKKFNELQHEHQLMLSQFEFYQLSATVMNQTLLSADLIEKPLDFPPVCPTTETQISKILQYALEDQKPEALQNVLHQLQKPDEIFQLKSLFQDLLDKQDSEAKWHTNEELKQISTERLADLFDGNGQVKTNQLTEKEIDIDLRKELKDQIIEIDLVGKETKSDMGPSSQQVEQVIDVIKEDYNEAAFEKLLKMMIEDKDIVPVIVKMFEDNWNNDRGLFGTDIQEGGLLTEQKREQILKEAKYLSTKAEISAELAGFKRRLNKDLSQGKFIPYQQKMLLTRYADFFGFMQKKTKNLDATERKKWQLGYRKIVSDALLQLELKKIEFHADQTPGSYIENTILNLRKLGDADDIQVRHERHEAELNVVKTLLEGQGLVGREMQSIKHKLADAKLEGRLHASGIPKEQVTAYKTIIQTMDFMYEHLLDNSKELKKDFYTLPEGFPKQQRQWLMEVKATWIDGRIKDTISNCLEAIAVPEHWDLLIGLPPKEITEILCKMIEPYHLRISNGELGNDIEKSLMPHIQFHNKWKERLQGEMIQGVVDKQENFMEGVCAGVAGRWAVNDQRFPRASIEELCSPGLLKISKTDRFLQVASSLAFKLKKTLSSQDPSDDLLEKAFPPTLRRVLGIEKMKMLEHFHGPIDASSNSYKVVTPKELAEFKNYILKNRKQLKKSHGVMVIRLDFKSAAHRIYLRFDPKASIFRLGEPNAGIFELKNQEDFFECFADLCEIFYKDSAVREIRAMQLTLS